MVRFGRFLRTAGIATAGLLALATVGSVAFNVATRARDQPATALYPGPYVEIDGRQIAYREYGDSGTPIVLVGGFLEASWVWDRVGRVLGRNHRVFALDLPPFGYSQRTGPYSLASWAQTTCAFSQHFGLERPLVVGHSLGAAVAVAAALSHPDELSGIVLVDGDALSDDRGGGSWVSRLAIEPFVTSTYRAATGSTWLFRRVLGVAYGPDVAPATATEVADWQRPFRVAGTQDAFLELTKLGIQGFSLADLRNVRVPATVVWGELDTVDPVAAGRSSADALGTTLVTIPGAGHLSLISHPDAVAGAIEDARKDGQRR